MSDVTTAPCTPDPARLPVRALLEQARRCGQALCDSNAQLWQFGRSMWFLDLLKPSYAPGYAIHSLLGGEIASVAGQRQHCEEDADPDGLDQEKLDAGTDRILDQSRLVWEFGTAVDALRAAAGGGLDALESQWPPGYLRFVQAAVRAFPREKIAGRDVDMGVLALMARAPHFLNKELLDLIEAHDYYRASTLLREVQPGPTKESPSAHSFAWELCLMLEEMGAREEPYRDVRAKRLWTWARIARAFEQEEITRPGIDEGKLACLLRAPPPVRRALLPLAPAIDHARLWAIVRWFRQDWEHTRYRIRRKFFPRLARRAAEMAHGEYANSLDY